MYDRLGKGPGGHETPADLRAVARISKPIKIAALTRYDKLGASSRLRIIQFLPHLRRLGYEVDVFPLMDDDCLKSRYANKPTRFFADLVKPGLQRLQKLMRSKDYDLVWLQREAFPYLPWFLERLSYLNLPPIIVDYDDAVFHQYESEKNVLIRHLLNGKIENVMRSAAAVVVGNDYLYSKAALAGAKKIFQIPTVVEPEKYDIPPASRPEGFRIGWIGTPSTAKYLNLIAPALSRAQSELGAEVIIIGLTHLNLPGVNAKLIPWSEETEAAELSKLSVGIMPLDNTPWELGKCGYKLIQYMASGLPVVASPIGTNASIVQHGVNGYLPASEGEWYAAFEQLKAQPQFATRFGEIGRQQVRSKYSIDVAIAELLNSFDYALARRTHKGETIPEAGTFKRLSRQHKPFAMT
jgi:glycosyltransferase involved in cell wall biosynthesis